MRPDLSLLVEYDLLLNSTRSTIALVFAVFPGVEILLTTHEFKELEERVSTSKLFPRFQS